MHHEITSRQNERIKAVVRLRQKKYRDKTGLFLIDGLKLFLEAFHSGAAIDSLFYTEGFLDRAPQTFYQALEYCDSKAIPVYRVSQPVMEALSPMKAPEGLVGVAKKFPECDFQQLRNLKTCVILEDVQDPGNVGTIIRTADAAGFQAVICTEKSADIYNEKVLRASMGSVFHLPVFYSKMQTVLAELRAANTRIIGSSLKGTETAFTVNAPEKSKKVALILGNESRGMLPETEEQCDALHKIPMYGQAESLNVSVAAGILIYDIARSLHG